MSIKEIIDAERWSQKRRDGWWEVKHNSSLNRIEASVTARIKELEKQVSTLEKAFIFEGKKYEERIRDLEKKERCETSKDLTTVYMYAFLQGQESMRGEK